MGRKKKNRKYEYDPVKSLQPICLNPKAEVIARELYELACCSANKLSEELVSMESLQQAGSVETFLETSHIGMREAQAMIVDQLKINNDLIESHRVIFRETADSIAWQLLHFQLCYARRFYKGNRQPDIANSNFESVVTASAEIVNAEAGGVALISDLTSFIQVGDLLVMKPIGEIVIVEVKEGVQNRKIYDFMDFYARSKCDRAAQYFLREEGRKTHQQMNRMCRQLGRMAHVANVVNEGASVDPDTNQEVRIPHETIFAETWDNDLSFLMNESLKKGWELDVIDGCLFLGCYSSGSLKYAGYAAFNAWFDSRGGTPSCPRYQLFDAVRVPLALPIFCLNIDSEKKFDILFGRTNVCIGINVEALLSECKNIGLCVRYGSNRETSKLDQKKLHPYRHKGKSIFIGNGTREFALMDGLFLRIIFHQQRPLSLIKSMFENQGVHSSKDDEVP